MRKRLAALVLGLSLSCSNAGAVFSDIPDSQLAQTASTLESLGIMQGVGGGRFSPDTPLTRAQFCKIASASLGLKDVNRFGSYTIFPDVEATHWAAKYVNAMVRHPNLKQKYLIHGYADGTFRPDRPLNFGEICTLLLRMLGYTEKDVGPIWPTDYIKEAKYLGLTENASISDPKAPVNRRNAALMLFNALYTRGLDGSTLIDNLSSPVQPETEPEEPDEPDTQNQEPQ